MRNKKGQFIKGNKSYWLGKKNPHSAGNKYSVGRKRSEKTRKRISDTLKRNGIKPMVRNIFPVGKNHPNWKGGITNENRKTRTSPEYKYWRKNVFIRDNFICQKCKVSGGTLRAHHINNFSDFPELRLIESNGVTFCISCHKEFHHKYGNKNNTREQLEEFLIS